MKAPPHLIIIGLYVLAALLVDPRGEFPLNDDWSYSRAAFGFARTGRIQVDEWSAMSLAGQALYGGFLCKLFGNSFLVLRLSTLVLSCALSLVLLETFRKLGASSGLYWVALLAWVFNPIQFCLSFTYMTEIPFLFFIGLGIFFFVSYLAQGETRFILGCGAAIGYAFLIRQTAAVYLAAMLATLLLARDSDGWKQSLRKAWLCAAASIPFVASYVVWLLLQGGPTPATRRKLDLLARISWEQILGNLYGAAFYVSFMLLPLLAYGLPHAARRWRSADQSLRWCVLGAWLLFSAFGLWWFRAHYSRAQYLMSEAYHDRMPFLLNILYDTGLGPLTLDPTYYRAAPTPVYPALWRAVTLAVGVGLAVLGVAASPGVCRASERPAGRCVSFFAAFATLSLTAFEVAFSHLEEGGLFDRHVLVAALPAMLLLVAAESKEGARKVSRSAAAATAIMLAALAYFCVAATHDYLQWSRLRWGLGEELLTRNVDPLHVAGGFEFNGWHNYDAFRSRGNVGQVYYWWYDKRDYLIAMAPEDGYEIIRRREYFSWVHRIHVPVYVLKKRE